MGSLTYTVGGDSNLVSFKSAAMVPITSLKAHFLPKQEGSGDPSPENVRPITGWTGIEISHDDIYIPITFPVLGKNKFNINATLQDNNFFEPDTYSIGLIYQRTKDRWLDGLSYLSDYSNENNTITFSTSGASAYGYAYAISVMPNCKYILSMTGTNYKNSVQFWNVNNNSNACLGQVNAAAEEDLPFETPDNTNILTVYIKPKATNVTVTVTDIQLELGNTATTYEPYSSNNTVYGGYVDIAAGEVVATHSKFIVDSSITFAYSNRNTYNRFRASVAGLGLPLGGNVGVLFNYLQTGIEAPWHGFVNVGTGVANAKLDIYTPPSFTSADMLSEYLAEHPLEIYLRYASAIHYPIPKIELKTLLGQNNIWSNTNDVTEVSYALHDSSPIRAAKQRIAAFNAHKIADIKNTLRSNFSPNGSTWVDEVDIDFDAGDYIEASIDLSTCTVAKENILSIGTLIDTWAVASSPSHVTGTEDIAVHFYYPSASGSTGLIPSITYTGVKDGVESKHSKNLDTITLSDTTLIIKVDKNNVYVNGTGIITGSLVYTALTILQAKTHLLVGSLEGSNRSHAAYNYIKVVRGC